MAQNVFEILLPLCGRRKSAKSYMKKVPLVDQYSDEQIIKEKVEVEFSKASYDEGEINGTVEDYSEMMV